MTDTTHTVESNRPFIKPVEYVGDIHNNNSDIITTFETIETPDFLPNRAKVVEMDEDKLTTLCGAENVSELSAETIQDLSHMAEYLLKPLTLDINRNKNIDLLIQKQYTITQTKDIKINSDVTF